MVRRLVPDLGRLARDDQAVMISTTRSEAPKAPKQRVAVQRHGDRVSTSFCDDLADVDFVITVTFDARVVSGLSDDTVVTLARRKLIAWALS